MQGLEGGAKKGEELSTKPPTYTAQSPPQTKPQPVKKET